MEKRKMIIVIFAVLIAAACLAKARVRDVKAIGEAALRKGVISAPPAGHDFTKIPKGASYKEGRLIVRFEPRETKGRLSVMSAMEKGRILDSLGAKENRSFDIVPGLSLVELPEGMTVEEGLKKFNKQGGILYAEPDYRVTAFSTTPDDPMFEDLWGMSQIDAPEAWDIITDSNLIVAVIDSGIDYTHPDLAANMWINPGEDFPPLGVVGPEDFNGVDDDGSGYVDDLYGYDFCNNDADPKDDFFHGTHCAGIIGAVGNNKRGVTGVCWSVKIIALKFLNSGGYGWESDSIKCIEYSVEMGANLTSNSYGGRLYVQSVKDAIEASGEAGMLFVAAAGNDNLNNDNDPCYPASYDCNNIISVMATTLSDSKASYSNYGPTSVDIGAPGGYGGLPWTKEKDILSTFPTYTTAWMDNYAPLSQNYSSVPGTSMAAPHVAGACALLWSLRPELDYSEVKEIILNTADDTSLTCVSGGRLNLYKALTYPLPKGVVTLGRDYYSCDDEIKITLIDSGLTGASQNVRIETTGGDIEAEFSLAEVDPCVYQGVIYTDGNEVDPNDNTLQLTNGDTITVTYYDANDGTGPAEVNDIAWADCNSPVISNVEYEEIVLLSGSQTITFETDEPTWAQIRYGEECNDPCAIEEFSEYFSTEHSITFDGLSPFTQYYFEIEATDKVGNVAVDDNDGNCYSFYTYPRNVYVPGDFNTIQDAVDDVYNGCIVWVAEGNYTGTGNRNIDFLGKAITVSSTDPNDPNVVAATVIDCDGSRGTPRCGFIFDSGEGVNSIVDGFTITDGYGQYVGFEGGYMGGAIFCEGASPTIRRCVLNDNMNDKVNNNTFGGAIGCYDGADPLIENCTIYDNEAYYGGGVSVFVNCEPTIRNCLIYDNEGVYGGGIAGGGFEALNCTIVSNSATTGGGVWSYGSETITNCILWDNGDDLYNCSATYSCISDCNDVNANNHNICSDPCFVDADSNDFHLGFVSPCIDSGDLNGDYDGQMDIDNEYRVVGLGVDIGADEKAGRVYNDTQGEWYKYIQDAIDDANNGDKIIVYPGIYPENIDFSYGGDITMQSIDPNDPSVVEATIIEASNNENAVTFESQASAALLFRGLTVKNGSCGIWSLFANPNISNCIIDGCGLGIGLFAMTDDVTLKNNIIRNCNSYGIQVSMGGSATILNSLIYDNANGICADTGSDVNAINNTIVDNTNRGIKADSTSVTICNCILWGNGDDLYNCSATYSCISNCNDVNASNHNICAAPCFVDAGSNDFHIDINSPCVNAGDPNGDYDGQVDIDGDARVIGLYVDMGADEVSCFSWWEFDDGNGTTASDSIGENDGTITNASWYDDPCRGMCLDFDGSGDYVTVSDSNSMQSIDGNTVDYTISLWVSTTQSGAAKWSEKAIFDRRATNALSGENDWVAHIYLNADDAASFFIRDHVDGNDVTLELNDTLSINDGDWYHIAAVRKGTDYVKIYINGNLRQSGSTTASPSTTEITTIGVRRTNSNVKTGYFDGRIDDVRIYNRALSDEDVEDIFYGG